jgi:hypothetical protein
VRLKVQTSDERVSLRERSREGRGVLPSCARAYPRDEFGVPIWRPSHVRAHTREA